MNNNVWIYDIETLRYCFTLSAYNIDTTEVVQYVLHKERNDLYEFMEHLSTCKGQIGFNNIAFDYPVIHYILENMSELWENDIELCISDIYNKAMDIISEQKKFVNIIWKPKIPQLDLFKIWHYDNKARSTSLKALEVSMNYPNVLEMPIYHSKDKITLKDVDSILEYNLNDVMATYEFYKKTVECGKIELRKSIINKFNLPCINWNNGKIGENLLLKLFCDKTGTNPHLVRDLRSNRLKMALKRCIPGNIKFYSKQFNNLLEFFKKQVITTTKGSIDYSLVYKGLQYFYGTGGIHASIKSGLYESNDEFIIKTCDVASLYPWIPIIYGFYPEHLGKEFLEVYRDNIVNVRAEEKKKPKNEQNKAIVDGLKEAANIPYGKSNDINSFLYDPLYAMKTTIAGQLVISMLCEQLAEIPNSQILMVNTDGLEIRIPREYEHMYEDICHYWEEETKLVLEFDNYQKMWIADINNYGCISINGKIKNKGRFEVDKVTGNEPAYHKDNSFRIVPLAIQEYFTNNTPIEYTIRNHINIYDFCGRQKFRGDDYGTINNIDIVNNKFESVKQQKITRYYISNRGSSFIKNYIKGSTEVINKGYLVTIFNKYINKNWGDYDINEKFYIKEANKEIDLIENKQMSINFEQ